jgi:hypothetical protein
MISRYEVATALVAGAALAAAVACSGDFPPAPSSTPSSTPQAATAPSVTLVGAGDMHAACNSYNRAAATAPLVERYPTALVMALGDNAGIHGTAAEYQCYDLTWGRFKSRTLPVLGNHELNIDTAATAYFDYFNGVGVDSGAAGNRARGYYARNHGSWRILVLTSRRQKIPEQTAWITKDLAANPRFCTLALWHTPLFTSSADVSPYSGVRPMWKALYDGGADLIVTGHAHQYERFAQMKSDGTVDTARGIRHFVVGSGGGILMPFSDSPHPASRKRISTHGILRLVLRPASYTWQFIDVTGDTLDAGQGRCH